MTKFRVRPKTASMESLRQKWPERVIQIDDELWVLPSSLAKIEWREMHPKTALTVGMKARQCVAYDRRCDDAARRRR